MPGDDKAKVWCLGVPCVAGTIGTYEKYNSNDGWVNTEMENREVAAIAAAFSHFTFEHSGGEEICVDIQGVGRQWTDPQLHSRTQQYGAGDC
eukprot:5832580-Amphidinium_carterae.1